MQSASQHDNFTDPVVQHFQGASRSGLAIATAVIGLLVGIALWSTLFFTIMDGVTGFASTTSAGPDDVIVGDAAALDCNSAVDRSTLSEVAQAAYRDQCATPTPLPPAATATPEPSLNRMSCREIRGTQYHSPEERTWYLANCV